MTALRPRGSPGTDHRESGFTLLELLVTISLVGIIVTLGASSFRHYWITRSVDQAQGEINAQLRQLQQRAVSESHPLVFGARFAVGSGTWSVVEYDPKSSSTTDDDVCTQDRTFTFSSDVEAVSASFAAAPSVVLTKCPDNSGSTFVFFYAKGTATTGRLEVGHDSIPKRQAVCVTGLTGRAYLQNGGTAC